MSAPKKDPRLIVVADCDTCPARLLREERADVYTCAFDEDLIHVGEGRPPGCPLHTRDVILRAAPRGGEER